MSNVKISTLPFKEQLRDRVKFAFYLALLIIVGALAYILPIDSNASIGMLAGGIGGIVGHYRSTRVSRLTLPSTVASQHEIHEYLLSIRYIKTNDDVSYVPDLHRFLRFDAQDIRVSIKDSCSCIFGPLYLMKKAKKYLSEGVEVIS